LKDLPDAHLQTLQNAVLETFDDGGLVLILPERRLVEANPEGLK